MQIEYQEIVVSELSHYVVEIKVTRVDIESGVATRGMTTNEIERASMKKRILDEVAHIVIKNKDLSRLKELTVDHLKLVSE